MYGPNTSKPELSLIAGILLAFCSAPVLFATANAQAVPQTVDVAKVNVQKVPAGFRASKIIGSNVFDDANENIGKVDDLLVSPQGGSAFAVLSIGGFLGLDSRYVAVPYDNLASNDNKLVLRGSNKNSLKMLPEFKYADK